jgi:hypothetical protein
MANFYILLKNKKKLSICYSDCALIFLKFLCNALLLLSSKIQMDIKSMQGKILKLIRLWVGLVLLLSTSVGVTSTAFDVAEVNGHPGYLTAQEMSSDGVVDKVLVVVKGFDTDNTEHPSEDLNGKYQSIIDELQADGWDIVVFDYVRGGIDLKKNAENLAHFIRYLDSIAIPDYHLALVGGSMGGIVARTMFVQEYSNMGVDTYISLDAPHHGVYLSPWVSDLAVLAIDAEAGYQMAHGEPEYEEHYGWLQGVEASPEFMESVINPIMTYAIALSDGEAQWEVNWTDLAIHTRYHPVTSSVKTSGRELESDYVPYHSAVLLDATSISKKRKWNRNHYWYDDTTTSYFDFKQANPKTEHGGPAFAMQNADHA